MASTYERRQRALLIIGLVLAIGGTTSALMAWQIHVGAAIAVAVVVALIIGNFGSLNVRVDSKAVTLSFGVGLISRTIPLDRIEAVEEVRNRWWYGWGIRLTPRGWLWNVSGLDAVELRYRGGGVFRIGTDDPAGLRAALESRLG